MSYKPCHELREPYNTTESTRYTCGRCGADRRFPITRQCGAMGSMGGPCIHPSGHDGPHLYGPAEVASR